MRGNERQISLLLIVLLLIGGWAMSGFQTIGYQFPEVPAAVSNQTTDLSDKRILADSDFNPEEQLGVTGRTSYREKELRVDHTFNKQLAIGCH